MTDEEILRALAKNVKAALEKRVAHGPRRSNLTSSIMTAFRPYVDEVVTGIPPKAARDNDDRRQKIWLVSCEWWYGPSGKPDTKMAESEGRATDAKGVVKRYGGDMFVGLDAAAEALMQYAAQIMNAPSPDWSVAAFRKALGYLRPTIQRNNGHATMRRTSSDGRWHLICDVFREGSFPKE